MFKIAYFFIILFNSSVYAQNSTYFQACFNNKSIATSAIKEINFIKNKTDKIKLVGNCLDFYIDSTREELYTKFIQVKFLGLYKLSSLKNSKAKQCKLELITIENKKMNSTKLGATKRIKLHKQNDKSNSTTSMSIYISQGTTGSMIVDDEKLSIDCRVTNSGYNLEIKTSSPQVSLNTSRFIPYGQSIELGTFVQNINDKKKEISLSQGVQLQNKNGIKYSSIQLRAK